MNTQDIRVTKWHPVFRKDLMVAIEATLNINTDFNYDSNLLGEGMIRVSEHQRKIYNPAVVYDSHDSIGTRTIKFVPCFNGKVEYFRLCLWGKGISLKPFFIRFARFDEEKSFGFNDPSKPYIYLDFFSKKSDQFIPVFIKVLNRESGEMIFQMIEAKFDDTGIQLTVKKVSSAEVPPTLL